LCDHPDCLEFFLAEGWQQAYCAQHRDRTAAARARARTSRPKHERWLFVADESITVKFHDSLGRERVCNVGPAGYWAKDAWEFEQLLGLTTIREQLLGLTTIRAEKL
jgi:hypothetical protein